MFATGPGRREGEEAAMLIETDVYDERQLQI
jgi:hypothetical protein